MSTQIKELENFLEWLKTSPSTSSISSMSGGYVHVKFLIQSNLNQIQQKKEGEE